MRSSSHSHLGIFLVLLLVCAAGLGLYSSSREAAQAADSAMLHQGSSLDTGSGNLLWRHKTAGPVITSPAMANGIVYVGNYAYDFYALKASTGKLAWLYKMDYWVTSSPAVVNGVVYFGSDDTYVYALTAKPLLRRA